MRELRKFKSCDGIEFDTMAEAAKHECEVAIPLKLKTRLLKLYAAEHGAVTHEVELATIERIVQTCTSDRRAARIIRDTLDEFSKASIHLPLEPAHA
jgi:hypothetical protein